MPVELYLPTRQEINSVYSGTFAEEYSPRYIGMKNEGSVAELCPSMDFALAEDVGLVSNPSVFEDVTVPIDLGVLRQDGVAVYSAIGRGYGGVRNPCVPVVGQSKLSSHESSQVPGLDPPAGDVSQGSNAIHSTGSLRGRYKLVLGGGAPASSVASVSVDYKAGNS